MKIVPITIALMMIAATLSRDKVRDEVIRGGSASAVSADCPLKLVSWNIERGIQLADITAALREMRPAIVLLQEVDVDARRSGRVDVADQLASALGMNYFFAVEFEELGQGDRRRPAYHGQAVLTALPTLSARVIRFQHQTGFWNPHWFLPNWPVFQRRNGGRIGLVVEMEIGSRRLIAYNLHLESRGGEELRLLQMNEVIADIQRYPRDTPIIVAGDLNTRSQHAPAITAILDEGFRQAAGREVTSIHGTDLDWIFVRGPLCLTEGIVHRQVHASDHFPLSAQIECGITDCEK